MRGVSTQTADVDVPIPDQVLDARGLNCPLPVLKTKVLLGRMAAGQLLCVTATDSHARIDFEAYCARSGHELLRIREADGVLEFLIRRAEEPRRF